MHWLEMAMIIVLASRGTLELAASDALELEAPKELPEVSFFDRNRDDLALKDFRGEIVVLHLWATWCPPCVAELPKLDELQARLPDIRVVAISLDGRHSEAAQAFYSTQGISHIELYTAAPSETLEAVKATGLPSTFLIDRKGRLIARHDGMINWSDQRSVRFFAEILSRDPLNPPDEGQKND